MSELWMSTFRSAMPRSLFNTFTTGPKRANQNATIKYGTNPTKNATSHHARERERSRNRDGTAYGHHAGGTTTITRSSIAAHITIRDSE